MSAVEAVEPEPFVRGQELIYGGSMDLLHGAIVRVVASHLAYDGSGETRYAVEVLDVDGNIVTYLSNVRRTSMVPSP